MSFSAEISDFVKGFTAGAAVGGDIQDRKLKREEYEFDKAFKEKSYADTSARANRALDLRERGLNETLAERRANRAERERRAKQALDERAKDREERSANSLIGGADNAAPVDEWYDFDEAFPQQDNSDVDTGDDTGEDTGGYAKGGLVQHAADGAPVQAIPTEDDEEDASQEPGINREGKSDALFTEAAKVTRDVMDEWNNDLKEKPAAVETNPKKSQDRVASVKPATPDEIKAIDKVIDPDNTMEPYRKGAARLVKAYDFFVQKGDVNKARKIAGQIIKFNQMASMTLGNLAKVAIERGDLPAASKLVSDAYNNNVPDGGKIEAQPTPKGTIAYKITAADQAEAAAQQGEISAQQLWQLAGGIANGSEFLKRMTALAGRAPATSGSNGAAGGTKRSYTQTVGEAAQAMNRYEELSSAYAEADDDKKKELFNDLKDARKAAEDAYATAVRGAKGTGRKPGELQKDLTAARKNAMSALPDDPNAPEEGSGRTWSEWLTNPWSQQGYSPKDGEAIPAQPAAQAGPPPKDKRIKDKIYDTPKGKAVWTGEGWELIGE